MCFDPVSTMMMISTGAKIFGAVNEGRDKQAEYENKALANELMLEDERQKHGDSRKKLKRRAVRNVGRQIAQSARRGIAIDGSVADLVKSSGRDLDLERQQLDHNFGARREEMKFESSRFRLAGRRARRKGRFDAFAKVIDGGTRLVSGF